MYRLTSPGVLVLVGTLSLTQPGTAQVFRGAVLDEESKQPVLVAAVTLVDFFNTVRGVGMTDSVGRYELVAPGPGRYKIRADARGYRHTYSGEYIVQAGDTVEVDVIVSVDPDRPSVSVTRRRALVPGCVPLPGPSADSTPAACDGRWAVEVSNCLQQPIEVHDNSREDDLRILGEVAAWEYRVLYSLATSRPSVSIRPAEGSSPTDFRDRSRGLVAIRVYCDRYWRPRRERRTRASIRPRQRLSPPPHT